MRRIIAKNEPFTREVWSREQLIETWRRQGETFKAEWAAELPKGEELTIYRQGEWLDMCRGPHMPSTGRLDPQAFMTEWGIDPELKTRGGLRDGGHVARSARTIYLLQRKTAKPGEGLGKTTGWIHRTALRRRGASARSARRNASGRIRAHAARGRPLLKRMGGAAFPGLSFGGSDRRTVARNV